RSPPWLRSPRSPSRSRSTRRTRCFSPQASATSGGCSTVCSGPRTRRKAWARSWRSARRSGRGA
ncbi:MAG: Enoyl-CoA hydratase, partial [uncultured Sphingomonadaceae bacterium]